MKETHTPPKKMPYKAISNSDEQTRKIAEQFSKSLKGGEILCLHGELGSGKTTFVKGLAKGLGVKERIISPSFILLRSYNANRPEICKLYHIDLYRIEGIKDVEALGLGEIFSDKKGITAIEWAEKIRDILPKRRTNAFFRYRNENKREIEITFSE